MSHATQDKLTESSACMISEESEARTARRKGETLLHDACTVRNFTGKHLKEEAENALSLVGNVAKVTWRPPVNVPT